MNTQRWSLNSAKVTIFTALLPLTVGILTTATITPAFAQSVVIVNQGIPME